MLVHAGLTSIDMNPAEAHAPGDPTPNPPRLPEPDKANAIRVPPEWFPGVKDLTRGISDAEREPYYRVLAHCRPLDPGLLHEAGRQTANDAANSFRADPRNRGRTFSQFADIVQHPDRYRGKPITLHGYIQRLETMDAGENDEGLTTLHQAYLFTGDSLQNPYVVVCVEIPAGIPRPTKGNPTNDIFVTGYFFKLWSYEAERGRWAAPLVLAKTLEWRPGPVPWSARTGVRISMGIGLAILLLGLVAVVFKQRRDDRRFRQEQTRHESASARRELADFEQLEQEQ
jgi:hypothetical protein